MSADSGKQRVRVNVCGSELNIVTDERVTAEIVSDVAKKLEEEINRIMRGNFRISAKDAAVLCAMDAMSESDRRERELTERTDELDRIRELYESACAERDELKETVARLTEEAKVCRADDNNLQCNNLQCNKLHSNNENKSAEPQFIAEQIFTPQEREDLAHLTGAEKIEYVARLMRQSMKKDGGLT